MSETVHACYRTDDHYDGERDWKCEACDFVDFMEEAVAHVVKNQFVA